MYSNDFYNFIYEDVDFLKISSGIGANANILDPYSTVDYSLEQRLKALEQVAQYLHPDYGEDHRKAASKILHWFANHNDAPEELMYKAQQYLGRKP